MTRTSRFWGSILVDGQPRTEVRDLTGEAADDALYHRTVPEFRRFRVLDLEHASAADGRYCTGGKLCGPGAPCSNCIQAGIEFWYTYEERAKEHHFKPANLHARDRTGWSRLDYCPCRTSHDTEAKARKCAKRHKLPLIRYTDGNGNNDRWIDLRPEAGPLFGKGKS